MIYEFDVAIRIEADDPLEAADKLGEWLAEPQGIIYSIGAAPGSWRDVTAEEQAA